MTEKLDVQPFYFHLGESLRHTRKVAGISKEKMSHALGVSLPKYISIEEGMEEIDAYELYMFMRTVNLPLDVIAPWMCAD